MKVIEPYFEVRTPLTEDIHKEIEWAGRQCYQSNHKIENNSHIQFCKNIIARGHEAMLEFADITVLWVCDRGVSHELVRHRLTSFAQESTRYCNYNKDQFGGELTFIRPPFWNDIDYQIWEEHCEESERAYQALTEYGEVPATPQEARSILPNSLKTSIVMKKNIRGWRDFFKLRADKAAHPQMQQLAYPMLEFFQHELPVLFDDLKGELYNPDAQSWVERYQSVVGGW